MNSIIKYFTCPKLVQQFGIIKNIIEQFRNKKGLKHIENSEL